MALLIDSVRRNFGLKATAVVVSIVLWFTFNFFSTTHDAYSKTLEIPLVVHGTASGLVASTQIQHVTVELAGPRPDVDSVTPADLASFVDCAGKLPGVYALAVNVIGRDADKIKTIMPDQAVVIVDRYAYRTVPVIARDAQGGTLTNAAVAPATIQVTGGQSAVSRVVAAAVSVPEPGSLPAGFAAEMKPDPVDANMAHVAGVNVLGVVRVTGPGQQESGTK
jgi:YbbR domain-containing protein